MDYDSVREHLADIIDFWNEDSKDEDVKDLHVFLCQTIDDEASFKLYRYVPADYYNIRNIEKEKLHFSNNGKFNDVYEGIGVSNFSQLSPTQKQAIASMGNVCCFSETYNNILMWSHYADFHKGLCIEYDFKKLDSNDPLLGMLYPVVYDNKRLNNCKFVELADELLELKQELRDDAEELDKLWLRSIIPLLLKKSDNWKYEKEWRMVYSLQNYYDDYSDKDWDNYIVDCSCITAVYCGVRCDAEVVENIKEISARKKDPFDVYRMELSDSYYELNHVKL